MKTGFIAILAGTGLLLGACATSAPYGAASKSGAQGYSVQPIENNRFRVSYKDQDAGKARTRALRRAAEITQEQSQEWFQVVQAFDDGAELRRSSGTSVSIGGSTGSRGRSGVGLGVGFGIPLGGNSTGPVTHVLEILTGSGEKPEGAAVYDADDVLMNLAGL